MQAQHFNSVLIQSKFSWTFVAFSLADMMKNEFGYLKLYVIKIKSLIFQVGDHSGNVRLLAMLAGNKIKFSGLIVKVKISFIQARK